MESKYPSLKRPQMKLHCFQNKESASTRWAGKVTLQDIDGLFDDMDSASDVGDELLTMSPMLKTISNTEKKEMERELSPVPRQGHLTEEHPRCQMVSKGDVLHPAMKPVSPEMDIDMDIPFKEHGPIKTSSPIEGNMDMEERGHEKDRAVSPILFVCEDDVQEELKTVPLPIQKGQSNGKITNESGDDEVESPPNKFVLSKSKTSIHTKKVELSRKETAPVTEKTPKKHLALEAQRRTPMQGNADPPVSAVRQEPQHPSNEKKSEKVYRQPPVEICTHVGKDITAFLQKVREAGQPKPACPRKPLTQLKVSSPPPEPEDDFLILEEDAPLWFAIPSKTPHRMSKSMQRETSSTDQDRPAYKEVKDSQPETSEKQKDSGLTGSTSKGERQTVNQKTKKKGKGGVSHIAAISTAQTSPVRMKAAGPAGEIDEVFSSQEDLPADDVIEQDKQHNKKQRQRSKKPSKESKTDDKAEDQPKQSTASESVKGKSALKMEKKKAQKSSEVRSKSLKDGKDNAKKSRVKSLNGNKERIQGSDAVKEPLSMEPLKEQSQEPSSEEQGGAADLHSPGRQAEQNFCPAKKNMKPEGQRKVKSKDPANGKAKQTKTSSSDEDSQVLWKRKRNKPGEWWLSCTQSTEEAKVTDDPPMLKNSEQNRKRHEEAVPSPIKPRKDGDLKDNNQKLCAPSSSQTTGQKSVKKARLTKKRTKRTETPDKSAETDKDNVIVAEQIQDHQAQVLDQELDPEELSPLAFPHREHSLAPGDNIFDRVYHHAPNEKLPSTSAPKRTQQHVKMPVPEKRRRKAPGNWWRVDDTAEDVEGISSQPQKPHCKTPKTHKGEGMRSKQWKSSALGTPKNGNMAVSPKPLGGAPEPLLKQKPPAPNTVRAPLAIFKDIFTSATESPPVANTRNACQKSRRKMLFPLQEEQSVQSSNVICCLTQDPVPATDCNKFDNTDNATVTMDAAEFRKRRSWPSNHEMLWDGKRHSDSTLKGFRSGPPSMIELEHYGENMLSESEMCGPPLRPLVLQVKDKANLTEWLKVLWPATVNNGGEVTPDQFEWYFYQGRAMGLRVDLHCDSFCNGKILLGSYMKKPLWIDHNAITVFNVSTSCVIVTINGKESHFNPGQSFVVPCGQAYSIQNLTEVPAVLYFNRMLAESPD